MEEEQEPALQGSVPLTGVLLSCSQDVFRAVCVQQGYAHCNNLAVTPLAEAPYKLACCCMLCSYSSFEAKQWLARTHNHMIVCC
jgi:hypothetical protein